MSTNGDQKDVPDKARLRCKEPGCNVTIRAANAQQAKQAMALHIALVHPKEKK